MIKYSGNTINDWNYDESNINKVYYNSSVVYQKVTAGDTPTPPSPSGYSEQYLTFIPVSGSSTFKFSGNTVEYSLDSGATWTSLASNTNTPTVTAGNKIMWKATLTPSSNGIGIFSATGQFDVEGNAMSLLYGNNFIGEDDLTGKNYAFKALFSGCTKVVSAENLSLPATTLASYCYNQMFYGCSGLTSVPSELPATTLADNCYRQMFNTCTSLTTVPSDYLPATTLVNYCYRNMFSDCPSLTNAPNFPATTVASECCQNMFIRCTSLTTAPSILPATTLATRCYQGMFFGTALTTAPELPATTLVTDCYRNMFDGCRNLNYIKCLAINISASNCTSDWMQNVAANGTFVKAASMNDWPSGRSGIPSGWTVIDNV